MHALPVDAVLPQFLAELRAHKNAVLVAPPGAGKTTRVPSALIDANLLSAAHPRVVMLQPRRLAARAAAARMSELRGTELGTEVGYHVRFEQKSSEQTRILVVTEGILERMLHSNPFLEGIGVVILDEFHERSVHTDLAIAMLRELQETVREDLRLVVMSATLETEKLSKFLGDCPVVRSEGKIFPVETEFQRYPVSMRDGAKVVETVATLVREAAEKKETQHLLVFLPGVAEIERTRGVLAEWAQTKNILLLPLHASLHKRDQDRALQPSVQQKILLATNIAETSLTIDGVNTVIDTGLARLAHFDPGLGTQRLQLARISRASATQRAGRAGRQGLGFCYRLWTRAEDGQLEAATAPEIERVDLAPALLTLVQWGAKLSAFAWYERPPEKLLQAGTQLLQLLGAFDTHSALTADGKKLARWPLHPRLALLIETGAREGWLAEAALAASIVHEKDFAAGFDPYASAAHAPHSESDIVYRMQLFCEAERSGFRSLPYGLNRTALEGVGRARDQLLRVARAQGLQAQSEKQDPMHREREILRGLLRAFPDRVSRRRKVGDDRALMVGGRGVRLVAESLVKTSELFVSLDPFDVRREGKLESQVHLASPVEKEWLKEIFPQWVREERNAHFNVSEGRVTASAVLSFRDLPLSEAQPVKANAPEAAPLFAAHLSSNFEVFLTSAPELATWLKRVDFLRHAVPELHLPSFDRERIQTIVGEACENLAAVHLPTPHELLPFFAAALSHEQQRALHGQAPDHFVAPTGSKLPLRYEGPNDAPVLAVRLQEMFGQKINPSVASGRVAITLELLAPNYRPVQVTRDLTSFWHKVYAEVRRELRARYPKHSWPEDPLTAPPVAKGRSRR